MSPQMWGGGRSIFGSSEFVSFFRLDQDAETEAGHKQDFFFSDVLSAGGPENETEEKNLGLIQEGRVVCKSRRGRNKFIYFYLSNYLFYPPIR